MITNLLSALGWIPNIFLPCKQVRRHIGAIFVQRRLRARNTCWITCANTQESRHIAAHTARRRLRARSILRITYISTRVRHHRSSSGGQSCTATYTHTHTHTPRRFMRARSIFSKEGTCAPAHGWIADAPLPYMCGTMWNSACERSLTHVLALYDPPPPPRCSLRVEEHLSV